MSTKTWILVVAVAAGCQAAQGLDPGMDASDKMTKTPPPPSGGGNTSAGCGGVTERGECRSSGDREVAVSCDLAANQLRQINCTAMGKHCVVDTHRGASCELLTPPSPMPDAGVRPDAGTAPRPDAGAPRPDAGTMPPRPDAGTTPPRADAGSTPMCPSGIDFRGYCWGEVAVWCDPATGTTYLWNCPLDGKHCGEDECATGAYCCAGTSTPMPDAAPMPASECDRLGYNGECSGMHARWCSGGQVIDIDCATRNQVCGMDQCASGAYCCDPPAPPPVDECTRLGLAGECAGNTARWCSSGTVQELDCTAQGKTCQVDTCAYGAYCCP